MIASPRRQACAGDSQQGDECSDGPHTRPDVVEAGSGVGAQAEAIAVI